MMTLITINSKENLNFISENWSQLIKSPNFTIILINPFSNTEHKWMIKPYVHNMITEKSALKPGLKAMANTVDAITEKQFIQHL